MNLKKQPRLVFHLAGNSATWKRDHRCNDVGTRNLIGSLKGLAPGSHVLFTSSIAVMDVRRNYTTPVTEETAVAAMPLTDYGVSKLKAENWLRQQALAIGFSLSIVRPVTVYGPQPHQNTLFPVLKKHALRRSPLARLNWPGLTGLLHVDDVSTILLSLAHQPPPSGCSAIYLAQGEARSLPEISQIVHARLGLPYEPIHLPNWFWKAFFYGCGLTLRYRAMLPARHHGSLWRLRLVAGNVFWADVQKLRSAIPDWKPALLDEQIGEVLR